MTGYVLGIIAEKVDARKLKKRTAEAIAEMVEAVGDGIRKELIDEERGIETIVEPEIITFEDFADAAEADSE